VSFFLLYLDLDKSLLTKYANTSSLRLVFTKLATIKQR